MKTLGIIDLRDFLNQHRYEPGTYEDISYYFTSKQCPDFEIVLENHEDKDGTKVWDIAIDGVPHDENTMSDWLINRDIITHEVSKFDDWTLPKDCVDEMREVLQKVKNEVLNEIELHSFTIQYSYENGVQK